MKLEDCAKGTKVRAYMNAYMQDLRIEDVKGLQVVLIDEGGRLYYVCPQQLRKLVKKPRNRWWICKMGDTGDNICGAASCTTETMKKRGCREVIEVRRKGK